MGGPDGCTCGRVSPCDYYTGIVHILLTDAPLTRELSRRWQHRDHINGRVVQHLIEALKLRGFSGVLEAGRRVGRPSSDHGAVPLPSWAYIRTLPQAEDDMDDWVDILGVANEREAVAMVDYMDSLNGFEMSQHQ